MATDINVKALEAANKMALHNKCELELIQTNLATSLLEKMSSKIDIMIFNPVSNGN